MDTLLDTTQIGALVALIGFEVAAVAGVYLAVINALSPSCTCLKAITRQSGEGLGHVVSCALRTI